jgi:hypothetical protein
LNFYFIRRNDEQILKSQEKGGREVRKEGRTEGMKEKTKNEERKIKEMQFEENVNFEGSSG